MSLFNDVLGHNESIFRNELALDYSFVPKLVPYREGEQRRVAECITPLFSQRSGRNLFVFGKPGVGKTVALKHVIDELEEKTDDIIPVYINCWQHNSSFKVFLEICNAIGYKFTQNKRSDELFIVIRQIINKSSAVFVLDEIDKLDDYDFLYSILEDIYRKCIIAITNEKDWLSSLDTRIRSRLMAESLEFRSYNKEETRGILKQRLEHAFVPGSVDDSAFELVASKAFEMSDIRRGLYLLRQSGMVAQSRSSKKVTVADVESALDSFDDFSVSDPSGLEEEDRFILELVKKNSGKRIGDIYKAYQVAGGKAVYRTFQRRVDHLEKERFVEVKKSGGGPDGNTSIISIPSEKRLTDF